MANSIRARVSVVALSAQLRWHVICSAGLLQVQPHACRTQLLLALAVSFPLRSGLPGAKG